MSSFDKRGNPVSYGSQQAVEALDRVFDLLHAYQADPLAEVDQLIAEHPDFALAHVFRAGALATATDKAFEDELRKSLLAAEALLAHTNERERMHIGALRAWFEGDWERAVERWGRVSIAYPRDLLALQFAHLGDFYLGYSHMLRDRVAQVLPHWNQDTPGFGFVKGMYAFGLEESGDYLQAEEQGREAVTLNPQDGWAVHAVTHVMEMQARNTWPVTPRAGRPTACSPFISGGTKPCFTWKPMTRPARCRYTTSTSLPQVSLKRLSYSMAPPYSGAWHSWAMRSARAGMSWRKNGRHAATTLTTPSTM